MIVAAGSGFPLYFFKISGIPTPSFPPSLYMGEVKFPIFSITLSGFMTKKWSPLKNLCSLQKFTTAEKTRLNLELQNVLKLQNVLL